MVATKTKPKVKAPIWSEVLAPDRPFCSWSHRCGGVPVRSVSFKLRTGTEYAERTMNLCDLHAKLFHRKHELVRNAGPQET